MTQRLFVAVVPPASVRNAWDAFLEPRRDAGAELRWVLPESWHVTCAFMGRVADADTAGLDEALGAVAARTAPFTVAVEGCGAFPNPDVAKVLWLGVTAGTRELGELAVRCRNAATGCGIEVDGGRFRPHVTIARANGERVLRWLQVLEAIGQQTWQVTGFRLVRSQSLPAGSGYRTVGEYALTGR
jgi:2'-5' RNA ligase